MALTNKLSNIADAIRTKNGTSAKLSLDDMASSILAIESGSGSGNVDVGSYHVWCKNTLPNIIVEEAVGRLYVSGNSVTNKENYGTLVYSDSIEISNGIVVLVNPTTISNAKKSALDGVIQGKYIKQTNTVYRVPSDSIVGTTSFNTTTKVYVDDLYELSVSGEKGNFIEFVFSKTSNTYPTDGEQGDYYYVYKGIVSDEVADPLLQSKTVTPSEEVQTIKPDTDYDGLSQVTVKAIDSTYVGSGITKVEATEYTPGTSDQTITSGQYLNGAQTIKGDANLVTGNIKSGVSIFGVSGSYAGSGGSSGGLDTSDATATAGDIVSGKTAYVNAEKITGTLSTLYMAPGTPEYNTSPDQIKISTSLTERYIVENTVSLTAKASDFGDAVPSDVVSGKTFTSASGLKLTGTHECSSPTLQSKTVTPSESVQTVTPDSGYDGLSEVDVEAISGTYVGSGVTRKDAEIYTPGTSDQMIPLGQYLDGTQTIKGDANLIASNIKNGVSIFGVSGTYAGSGSSSGGLTIKTGTTTEDGFDTGLSTIKLVIIYRDSFSTTGFINGFYNADEGKMHYVYCSSYSTYMKSCSSGTSTAATVDGGTLTTGLSGNSALNSGITYHWIAVGEE